MDTILFGGTLVSWLLARFQNPYLFDVPISTICFRCPQTETFTIPVESYTPILAPTRCLPTVLPVDNVTSTASLVPAYLASPPPDVLKFLLDCLQSVNTTAVCIATIVALLFSLGFLCFVRRAAKAASSEKTFASKHAAAAADQSSVVKTATKEDSHTAAAQPSVVKTATEEDSHTRTPLKEDETTVVKADSEVLLKAQQDAEKALQEQVKVNEALREELSVGKAAAQALRVEITQLQESLAAANTAPPPPAPTLPYSQVEITHESPAQALDMQTKSIFDFEEISPLDDAEPAVQSTIEQHDRTENVERGTDMYSSMHAAPRPVEGAHESAAHQHPEGDRVPDLTNTVCYYVKHDEDGTRHPCRMTGTGRCCGDPTKYCSDGSYFYPPAHSYFGGMPEDLYTRDAATDTWTAPQAVLDYFKGRQDPADPFLTFDEDTRRAIKTDDSKRNKFAKKNALCRWCMIHFVPNKRLLPPDQRAETRFAEFQQWVV